MKNILVPTDFSDCASNAVKVAIEIAKKTDATLHFLHFTDLVSDWNNLTDQERLYSEVTLRIEEIKKELGLLTDFAKKAGVESHTELGIGGNYSYILEYAEEKGIDMIVMGSHGAKGIKELLVGSNAQKIIRLSDVPVLIVKEGVPGFQFDRLVIVSDFSDELEAESTLPKCIGRLVNMANALGLSARLLFINTPNDFMSTRLMRPRLDKYRKLYDLEPSRSEITCAWTIEDGVRDYMEEHPGALFAMMTHGHKGVKRLVNGSTVESIANHLDTAILSMKLYA